jgi:hypothetical protein
MSELDNVDTDVEVDAEEILEMSTEKLDEINVKKKKNSLLNEVLVTGLLKNINDKVSNKLDTDAQSELVDIINERVKDGYEGGPVDLESEIEKAISFDEDPTDDHLISTANKNRAKLPANRRLPSKESKLSFSDIQEQLVDMEDVDKVDEDFDNLFNDDDVNEPNQSTDKAQKELSTNSYIDDFDALLGSDTTELMEIENDEKTDVDADFDALLKAENIEIESTKTIEKSPSKDEEVKEEIDGERLKENAPLNEKIVTLPVEESCKKESILDKETPLDVDLSLKENTDKKINLTVEENALVEPDIEKEEEKESTLKESNLNDSLEDIFKNLEKSQPNLIEIEHLLENDSLDESNSRANEQMMTKVQSENIKDPFDDLFDELDEENLEDVDKGFQQLYENKKTMAEEDKVSPNLDVVGQVLEIEDNTGAESGTVLSDLEEHPEIENTIGRDAGEDGQANTNENNDEVDNEESVCLSQGLLNQADDKVKYEQEIQDRENAMKSELANFKQKIDQLEKEKEKLKNEIKLLAEKDVLEINKSGKKVIVPTENHDQEKLDEEIRNDTREAELLIQLKHLSERVEVQDTLLAETKEDNTVLRIQNQSLLESLNKANSKTKKKSIDTPSLDWIDGDDSIEKKRLFLLEQELEDQKEVNKQFKAYVGDILINIIVQNPQILEKKK